MDDQVFDVAVIALLYAAFAGVLAIAQYFIERSEMRARAKARVRPGERRPMRFSVQHGTPGWREDEEVDAMVIRNLRGQR